MSKLKIALFFIVLSFVCQRGLAQEEEEDDDDYADKFEHLAKYKGVAIDIFPLVNSIFSDDGGNSLFQVNYIWGKGRHHSEFGFSPQYSHFKSEQDVSNQTLIGASVEMFGGEKFDIGKKWQGVWGVRFNYGYQHQTSKLFSNNSNERKTQTHSAALGPQFMFGYKFSDKVQIRSRIAGLLQFRDTTTKIGDGPNNAGKQNLTIIDFNFNAPSMLELVFIL
jgi:hypothetical protein